MGRSGYSYDLDNWDLIRWRGAVASAIRGQRGQAFLREMLAALDAMPEKSLITEELEHEGAVCALGSVGKARGINMADVDPYEREDVAKLFGIPESLAAEIMDENDRGRQTPEQRWTGMRDWIIEHLRKPTPHSAGASGE